MKKGTQIAYVPTHVNGNVNHPDVQFGFVMSEREGAHFCRYWRKDHPGQLRTVANSELTPNDCLMPYHKVPQYLVEQAIDAIEKDAERFEQSQRIEQLHTFDDQFEENA